MTLADRQHSCPACGKTFKPGEAFDFEVVIDPTVRYIAVHPNHKTFIHPEVISNDNSGTTNQ